MYLLKDVVSFLYIFLAQSVSSSAKQNIILQAGMALLFIHSFIHSCKQLAGCLLKTLINCHSEWLRKSPWYLTTLKNTRSRCKSTCDISQQVIIMGNHPWVSKRRVSQHSAQPRLNTSVSQQLARRSFRGDLSYHQSWLCSATTVGKPFRDALHETGIP